MSLIMVQSPDWSERLEIPRAGFSGQVGSWAPQTQIARDTFPFLDTHKKSPLGSVGPRRIAREPRNLNLVHFLREDTVFSFPFAPRIQCPSSHQQRLGTARFRAVYTRCQDIGKRQMTCSGGFSPPNPPSRFPQMIDNLHGNLEILIT